jgi:outer membrane cobalamin receptor
VELAPIHVTGSRLPRTSVQTTLPVTIIDRDDILRSGYGSLFDLLRHLPGMNGHPAMSTSRSGDSQYLPVGAATTTSLDGMGPRATLFLVNGRRLPRYPMVSLEQGGLTDLGGIPLSFVERIELVRGGASAIYGADAMSGVVNIILRDQADGPEAMLQTGLSRRGDAGQYRVQAATGGVRDGGRPLVRRHRPAPHRPRGRRSPRLACGNLAVPDRRVPRWTLLAGKRCEGH